MSSQLHEPAALPPVEKLVPTEWEAGWSPEHTWKLQRTEKSLAPTGCEPGIVEPVEASLYHPASFHRAAETKCITLLVPRTGII